MKENKNPEVNMIIPFSCPYCKRETAIQFKMAFPEVVDILTAEIIKKTKETAIAGITASNLDAEAKKEAMEWINSPETFFGPKDVEEILKNLIKEKDDTLKEISS